jgi:hypothetical protein
MENFLIIGILLFVVVAAALYIYKAKKSGKKCIGCPSGCSCVQKGTTGCCGCHDSQPH